MIEKPVAIEHHALDALFDQPLRDRLPDRLGPGDVAAPLRLRQRTLDLRVYGRGRRDRPASHVVCHLHVHVGDAAEHGEARPRLGAVHAFPDPVLDPFPAIVLRLDLHRLSSGSWQWLPAYLAPVFPTFFFSTSPM